jgi:PAS domain S-box-containing protein
MRRALSMAAHAAGGALLCLGANPTYAAEHPALGAPASANGAWIVAAGLLAVLIGVAAALRRERTRRRATEERLRDYAATASDWYWETDTEHRFRFLSPRRAPVGIDPGSRLGRTRREIARNADLETAKWDEHEALLNRHEPFRNFVYSVAAEDGSARYVSVSGRPVFDKHGRFLGYRGTGTDITARHKAEEDLRASNERYDMAVRQAGIWDWDLVTNTVYYSPRFKELLGYGEREFDDLTAGSVKWLVDPEDWHRCLELLRSHLRNPGSPYSAEHRLLTKDRGYRWFHIRGQTICDQAGKPVRMAGILTDIDDRKRAEARLRDAIESLADGFILWDAEDRLVMRNEAVSRMDPEMGEMLVPGTSFAEFVERRVRLGRIAQALGREEAYVKERVAHHRNPTGEPFEQRLSNGRWVRMRERRTREGGIVSVRTEITPLKQREGELLAAKAEAESANRAKSEFLASMSHELRTPLNAIIGFSDLLRSGHVGPLDPKQQEYLENIHASGSHLLELINDILDVSKVEAGRYELHEEVVNPLDIISTCVALVEIRAQARQVAIDCVHGANRVTLRADDRALKQVVLNLLTNAVKFNRTGGRVVVQTRLDPDGTYAIAIADTGIGISATARERIFTPFQQADPTVSRRFEGTGLGLWISKALVELHGGQIEIESEENVGTTVTARLPAARVLGNVANAAD